MSVHSVTSLTPPRLASLPVEREQLEYSSRSIAFAEDGRRLFRTWGGPDRPWVLSVESDGARWRVEAWGAEAGTARAAVRALFSLDHPLEEFYRRVRTEPVLKGTERRFRGLRLPRDANLYEALLHAIVGQQLSVRAANSVTLRLLKRTDAFCEAAGVVVPSVPSPTVVRALGAQGLRGVGMSRAKARALLGLAEWVSRRYRSSSALSRAPLEDAIGELDRLPGVGRWTAENALLRGLGRRDVFVGGDLGVRVALDEFGAVSRAAPEEHARAWADRHYPQWGSYATLYLWRKLVADRNSPEVG